MLNKLQGRINGESFREVNRRRRSRRGIRENLHRLSGPGWTGKTMVANLSKRHSGLIPGLKNRILEVRSFLPNIDVLSLKALKNLICTARRKGLWP